MTARLLLLLALAVPAAAQPARLPGPADEAADLPEFGSADDVLELGAGGRPRERLAVGLFAGVAYLPDTWRGALHASVEARRGALSAGLEATLHPAAGGLYGPEGDELYDALRAVRYLRLAPAPGRPLYARLGPPERVTLGAGLLARGYRTTTAWDERTLGAEAAWETRHLRAAAFTGDVRLGGVVGGEVELRTARRLGPLGGLRLALGGVRDLGVGTGGPPRAGVEATLRGDALSDGTLAVTPFASAARWLGGGTGLGAGVEAGTPDLAGGLRARVRAGLVASSSGFVPGHVGPFYSVAGGRARLVDADAYDAREGVRLVGTPLDSLSGGLGLVLDVRLVAFGRAEVSQHVRRHVGPDRASAYGLRVAARLARGGRAELAFERQGFRGLRGLIAGGDETALVLDVTAPAGPAEAFVRSRYGFRRLDPADARAGAPVGPDRFVVERRFEPMLGLRWAW